MSASPSTTLEALLSLVSSSVELFKAEYAKKGYSIPSLDSTEPHPLDSQQPSLELKRAVQTLEGACAQLAVTVASPAHTMINRAMSVHELACLRVVLETKVADYIKDAGEAGLPLSELSTKAGIEAGKLGRILRLLATKHIFREVQKDVFARNRLSIPLESDEEVSSYILHFTDACTKGAVGLFDALSDPGYGSSYAPDKAPITKAYGMEEGKALFWLYNEVEPEMGKLTHGPVPVGSTVTDVGGGVGHISMDLARTFPQLNFVVQDLPATVDQGRELWQKEYPEGIEKKRVQFVAMDFLKNPPVEGSDIYYLRHVVHDWPDKECVQILQNVRKAMKPESRVLVHEYILQHVNRVSEAEAKSIQAPEPLLPNYGFGCVRQYNLDLNMMCMLNSKERTLEEFVQLGEQAALKFSKTYDTGEIGVVEFQLA